MERKQKGNIFSFDYFELSYVATVFMCASVACRPGDEILTNSNKKRTETLC